jgi:hypothetical protein
VKERLQTAVPGKPAEPRPHPSSVPPQPGAESAAQRV